MDPTMTDYDGSGIIDVLDRVLDKGIVIDAYVRVSVAGLDLVNVDARVVVASVDTYLNYADAIAFTPVGGEWVDRVERELSGAFGSILRRPRPPRLKRCADASCRRVFHDATRSRTRRWCNSGTCGNRARVRRHRSRSAGTA